MARLSNFLRKDDGIGDSPVECRPAHREEIDDALRLLLSGPHGLASDEQVLEFLSFCAPRGLDVGELWVAARARRLEWALLPVLNPGKTMLVLTPTRLSRHSSAPTIRTLADEVCRCHARQGIQLAQLLLDPQQPAVRDIYAEGGFVQLAELFYLSRAVRRAPDGVQMPDGFDFVNYSPANESLFAETIVNSYRNSLDCPGLNGMRNIADVLEGHKAAGDFDPNLWFILRERGEPRAVLLLNRSTHADSTELVYLGLIPEARGRGIGDLMMQLAITCVARDGRAELSLAVDAHNTPALSLYYRHGLQRIASRIAMLRDLRSLA